ncbi:uncharacterized protein LOC130712853 [Lotus japonicus]|uniref:uncharacterized protein LOC130712853 n=1 Tax=Lotus japonicus TaxID=34305 RepID=UPI002589A49E|nr:uncharacterized protein LOC130712853 [Lotus japonicus]
MAARARTIEQLTAFLTEQAERAGNGGGHQPAEEDVYHELDKFLKRDPPKFEGGYNPDRAYEWIRELERIYETFVCADPRKVAFASYLLSGKARTWWTGVRGRITPANGAITWEIFNNAFMEKYFPADAKGRKEMEFLELKQGMMAVGEYAAKFEELCRTSGFNPNNPFCVRCRRNGHRTQECRVVLGEQASTQASGNGNPNPTATTGEGSSRGAPAPKDNRKFGRPTNKGKVFAMTLEEVVEAPELIQGLEVILGMDWLAANDATLNCRKKTVTFGTSEGDAKRVKRTDRVGKASERESNVLLGTLETQRDDIGIEGIRVAREFPDVFPEEVSELPPEREVEFSIDLVPGTGPISIAPYRMSPVELAELKKQVEELMDKKFVRPSVSPW